MATTASAKRYHLTTQAEAFPTGSFKRFAVIFCAICDRFKVRCQASQKPHPLNITIGFSFQPTGRLKDRHSLFYVEDYILKQGYFMDLVKTQNRCLSDNGTRMPEYLFTAPKALIRKYSERKLKAGRALLLKLLVEINMKLAWRRLSKEIDTDNVNLGNEAKQIRTQLLILLSSKNRPSNNFGIPVNA
jgi:hypothetical protein